MPSDEDTWITQKAEEEDGAVIGPHAASSRRTAMDENELHNWPSYSTTAPTTVYIQTPAASAAHCGQFWNIGQFRYQVVSVNYSTGEIFLELR